MAGVTHAATASLRWASMAGVTHAATALLSASVATIGRTHATTSRSSEWERLAAKVTEVPL